jgi:hypothetical protein
LWPAEVHDSPLADTTHTDRICAMKNAVESSPTPLRGGQLAIGIMAMMVLSGVLFLVSSFWTYIPNRTRVSTLPGFRHFAELADVGRASPESALETFHVAIRNQSLDPIGSTRMKAIWNLPEDFDDSNAKYSIDIGQGIGPAIGYRIVSKEQVASNEVRLIYDYERRNGSSFRHEKVLVEKDGEWRLQPVRVTRKEQKQ